MKKIFLFFWFLPRRCYYAALSPEEQFKKLIKAIKRKHPPFYNDFELFLRKRFLVVNHPWSMHEFCIPVEGGREIQAYFEVGDTDDGLVSVLLQDVIKKETLEYHPFKNKYYGPGMS